MFIAFKELNSIISQINGAYHDICTKVGISDSEFDIFYVLCEQGDGCKQSLIYKSSGIGKSTINSAIKKMEKEGYLKVEKDDGRSTRVFLTDKGKARSAETAEHIIEIENRIYESFSKKDREAFIKLNRDYLNALKKEIDLYGVIKE